MRPITESDRDNGYIVITTVYPLDDDDLSGLNRVHLFVFNKELRMWHPNAHGIHLDFVESDSFIFIPWNNIRCYEIQRRSDSLCEQDLKTYREVHEREGKCYLPWGRTFFRDYMKPDESKGLV